MKYFLMAMLFPLMGVAQILRPNLIVNGDAVLDQRVSATITIPSGGIGTEYGPDRFRGGNTSSTGVGRIMQGTTALGEAPYTLGLRHTIKYLATTGHAPSGIEAANITNRLEGLDFYPYGKKTMTHSFWVRSKKTGAFCVGYKNTSGDRSLVKEFTISSADTWQELSHSINFAQATGGTEWLGTSGIGLSMFYFLSLGSTVTTGTSGAWSNSNPSVTTACRSNNLLAATNDYVEITGVRLTEGAQKVPFVRAGGGSYAAELALAQRYTQVYAVNGSANARILPVVYTGLSTTVASAMFSLPTPMRTNVPTLTTTGTSGDYGLRDLNGSGTTALSAGPTAAGASQTEHTTSLSVSGTVASGLTVGVPYALVAVGTARTYLIFSAEL